MNTSWLKGAIFIAIIVAAVFLTKNFIASKVDKTPKPQPKTVQDIWREDDERLRADPVIETQQQDEPTQPKTKQLLPEQQAHAEQLFELAITQRKIARLPGTGYKQMVDSCRQIIDLYPDSSYALKARNMLAEVPDRLRKQYKITSEEINPTK